MIKKVDGCEYNPDKLSTTKVSEHIPFVDFTDGNITDLFKFKQKITGQAGNDGTLNVEIMVPLKNLSNYWRAFKMLLFNSEISLVLNWSAIVSNHLMLL